MSESLKISTRGQGPELVLLHGWAMHSGIWGGVVDVLASEFRVNLVDLPGHGANHNVPLSRDLYEVAELILSELPPAVWIGWSLGGLVTLAAALRQPHKVHKAILVAATPCFSKQADWDLGVSVAAQQAFVDGLENDFEETLNQFCLQCFGAAWVAESLRRLGRATARDNVPAKHVMHTGLHLLYSNNLLADLSTCNVPMLFLGGTRDRTIRAESFEQAAAMLPAASSCLIRAAGHTPFISHQDQFLDIIHGYLRGDQ
ncbi:MAG: pimeloyl-ACP methyl ester esterase BioH [Lysobacterales bacterium]